MKIIYFKAGDSTFIQRDQKILEDHYSVEPYFIRNKPKYLYLFSLIRLFFFLLFKTRKFKMFFIRFADYHTVLLTFFARIFGKKLVIVIGGFDAAYLPEYHYGAYNNKIRSWCVKYSLRNASLLLPNNSSLIYNENTYEPGYRRKGGIRYFTPATKAIIKVIFNGFETKFWKMPNGVKKENLVLTVANIDNYQTYRIKGIDDYINVARRIPENNFLIVGMNKEKAEQFDITIPDNLTFISKLSATDLLNVYSRAKVFCLFSLTEGMPNVLCEAMLCECIPVASAINAIPAIIGETGFLNKSKDLDKILENVRRAFSSDSSLGKAARERIVSNYSIERRSKNIVDALTELVG